jgi:pyruvate,orthophosphate dikinase
MAAMTNPREKIQMVYSFGGGRAEGDARMAALLGGKGANLHEMSRLGLPVPPGFTLTTEVCRLYTRDRRFPDALRESVDAAIAGLGSRLGRHFGDAEAPLLLSVRSGAPVSMPGMMDTVLDIGINDATLPGLERQLGSRRAALDCRRRFAQMFGGVVAGIDDSLFEDQIDALRRIRSAPDDAALSTEDLAALVDTFESLYERETGETFPHDPHDQLWRSIAAVFDSWSNPRAVTWREIEHIPGDMGTAANVQAMVFGNAGDTSASGVAFTRDPATGYPRPTGEFLPNAQGEDIVSGTRTPQPLSRAADGQEHAGTSLEEWMPEAHARLLQIFDTLERHYRDMQDVEFTIERGELFVLQTRNGKRTAAAMVKVAHDLADQGQIDRATAISRVDPARLEQVLHPTLAPAKDGAGSILVARGLGASPGGAVGKIALDPRSAIDRAARGEPVVLVRRETAADDVGGMNAAQGVVTARGGATSHAAVVARGLGKPCVVGCAGLEIDNHAREVHTSHGILGEDDWITIDGTTGEVFKGRRDLESAKPSREFLDLMAWADDARRLGVRANADTPDDARRALELGAEGIGLCRTEHMFFAPDRIRIVRELVLTAGERSRRPELESRYREALDRLRPIQRSDFEEILQAMSGRPVTIRLLDPPLHEFLPSEEGDKDDLAVMLGLPRTDVDAMISALHEANPMLGLRGCRLGIVYPEIYEMQVRALCEATAAVRARGLDPRPEIMIPLVALPAELARLREMVIRVATEVLGAGAAAIHVGTMIELPRAALTAGRIAEHADFFSFGTNDLTQTTFGLSRDDATGFLGLYVESGILASDPFVTLDQEGVGEMVTLAVERGRSAKPGLVIGICGEHGGEPASVAFCHRAGLNYVSCSPFRVPVARLAAARASVAERHGPEEVFGDR